MAGQITGRGNQAQGIVALLLAAAFMNKANESFGGPPQQGPDLSQLFNTGNNDVPFLNDGQGAIPELLEALTGGLDEFPNGNGNNNLFNQSPFGQPPNPFQAMGQGAELMGDLMLMLVMDLLGQGQNQGQLPFGQQQQQQNPLGQLGNLFGSLPNLANGMADFCNPCTGNGFGSYGQQGQAAMTAFMAANENGFMMGAAIAAQMQQGCASPPQVCAPPSGCTLRFVHHPQVCAPPLKAVHHRLRSCTVHRHPVSRRHVLVVTHNHVASPNHAMAAVGLPHATARVSPWDSNAVTAAL
ncbi:MAG: hypothetical protein R2857_05535 [Vampirovibrionales bacterium]